MEAGTKGKMMRERACRVGVKGQRSGRIHFPSVQSGDGIIVQTYKINTNYHLHSSQPLSNRKGFIKALITNLANHVNWLDRLDLESIHVTLTCTDRHTGIRAYNTQQSQKGVQTYMQQIRM